MHTKSTSKSVTLIFPDLHTLWKFAQTLQNSPIEINSENKTLNCNCSDSEIANAIAYFKANVHTEPTTVQDKLLDQGSSKSVNGNETNYYNCPHCGKDLLNNHIDDISVYHCENGHSYSGNDLAVLQGSAIESSLLVAIRLMEERLHLYLQIEENCRKNSLNGGASEFSKRADFFRDQINNLRKIIASFKN